MPAATLDRTDRKILDLLQRDGRLSNVELAEKVALSPSPCLRRVRALEESGVVRQYVALLDPARVGLALLAYVNVKLEKRGKMPIDDFSKAVQAWPEVVACYSMTGEMDYLLRVQVEDLDHYTRFMMDRLLKQAGVLDVKSNFVLERIKDTTALPLAHLG
ncbi:MAG TPA: Lrp/AsnC family transcriptional regulator [Burkholderiales bacterium]|nr:Lrp/AsnC family transcriptional regulator [Burkholderiales bacterium]